MVPLLDRSWRAFILRMHKQLPPASKIAEVNMVSPACVGLCTSPITMASTLSYLFPLLSALLCLTTGHTLHLPLGCSACISLLLGLSHSPCFPLHKVCVLDLACLPCALHPWTHRSEDNLDCSSWSCSQDLWLVLHLLGLRGVPAEDVH